VAEGDGVEQATGIRSGTPDVFVSYASQDAAVTNSIVENLEQHGLRCWIAPRDVVPGSLYADEIVRAINDAKVLVLVLSEHAVASPHVGKEIERASSKRRRIIVLRIDSAPLTRAFEYFLSESQWIDLGPGGVEVATAKLVEAAQRHLEPTAVREPLSHSDEPAASRPTASRARWMVAGGLAVRNEAEYQEASKRLFEELGRLGDHRARLKEAGLGEIEIQRVIDPLESFHLQLKEEVEAYERLKRGEFEELETFEA
jgi:TIR domain-containing protein